MDIEKKTLSSPNYPKHFFADGKGCEWLINAPEGNLISLEFELLDVNLCKFVKVFVWVTWFFYFLFFSYPLQILCLFLMVYVTKHKN